MNDRTTRDDLGARKWWAIAALALALVAGGLDLTVLNLALPTLATSLHASTSQLQWIVDSYSLVLAAMLLPGGMLGDRYGRKKLLLVALGLFGATSLACAYSGSADALIAARAVLGIGAAFLLPLSLAVVPVLFSEAERPRAVTVLLSATVVAYPIGPILGGWLLTHFWWGSVFLINVPVTVLALIAVAVLLPETRGKERPTLDLTGVVTSSVGLAGLVFGVIEAGARGWGSSTALIPLIVGGVVLIAFVVWERRMEGRAGRAPLVDLGLFGSASFSWGTILATTVSFAMFGLLFAVPQYFQAVRQVDAMGAGVRLLPIIGGLLVGAAAADRLATKVDMKFKIAFGFVLIAGGLFGGATTNLNSSDAFTAAWVFVVGVGLGLALPASMDAAIGELSPERSGIGSAQIQAVRQVGATFGVAVLGSVINSAYRNHLILTGLPAQASAAVKDSVSAGVAVAHQFGSPQLLDSVRRAFVHGMDVMLVVCGGIAVVSVILTLAFLPRRRSPVPAVATPVTTGGGAGKV